MVQALPAAAQRVTNFDSDLSDSLALAALLISHWPELACFVSQLKLSPGNQAGMRYNAGTLVKMMEELQLPWTLQVHSCSRVASWQVWVCRTDCPVLENSLFCMLIPGAVLC